MRAAYFAFDRFPSSKGSAVHIGQMAGELSDHFGGGLLGVLGGGGLPRYQQEGDVRIARFDMRVPNLIDRAEAYSHWVAAHLRAHQETLELVHVRDPWSALPALGLPVKLVYEANGLPSIELPHTWPQAAPSTLAKLRALELRCLERADAVVVPSRVIGDAIRKMGINPEKIYHVPNGAHPVPSGHGPSPGSPATAPVSPAGAGPYLIYVGALQRWQGVDVLLRAFARLADLTTLRLVICSSVPERRARPFQRLAERLGVAERVVWRFTLPHEQVAGWLAGAAVSVAPLTACPRNLDQGCAPLKILESMAAGTPVVASDLPAVREILGDDGRLVAPDRPAELARAIRITLEYPEAARELAGRARRRVPTWADSRERLAAVYRRV
ncbi:glycosyltransferase family 4 protein [Nonomuraea sp. LPB2021202275-12-8]|uniref:glycosyltransferase family 4 protein n=1 Tax=Nonomuraea sp. LPB2021202275-12-8 TaxID=3120159 RepID=UPI00300C24BE